MKVKGKEYRTVWIEGNEVKLIEQRLLPHEFGFFTARDHKDIAFAIKEMVVRGAGAIGATAAYGVVLATLEANEHNYKNYISNAAKTIQSTRPTAQNIFTGTNYILDAINNLNDLEEIRKVAISMANEFADYDAFACKKIDEYGNRLIKDGFRIGTHCNAGWLAFVDWGSALSPIFLANRTGKKVFVYVDETRPRIQGSLTAWELANENVPYVIIADNATGYYMKKKEIDMVITGADRIAANGDVANKIGTYEKAVLAKENGVPFYVAAPTTTFDLETDSGELIPIEERHEDEMLFVHGTDENGNISKVRVYPKGSKVKNPAFDITPASYITGLITEKGIIKANREEIQKMFGV
ncbi:MAG: S-methyl-5-thioribose-1-phosphate isomerase [Bacteroidetes bacterium]|nr:S-methyl-5-thioribose-1-phosphate isomerase [Bacteroidota bacterium]